MRAELIGGTSVLITTRKDGDLGPPPLSPRADREYLTIEASERNRRAVLDTTWTIGRQMHGDRVVTVEHPRGVIDEEADGLVSKAPGIVLAALGADCGLVGLSSPEAVVGVAHVGWRGIVRGTLDATLHEMRGLGATRVEAIIGPLIHAECYEFSRSDLDVVEAAVGSSCSSRTASGGLALDLLLAITLVLERDDVVVRAHLGGCTACGGEWFSHRARAEHARHALVVIGPT